MFENAVFNAIRDVETYDISSGIPEKNWILLCLERLAWKLNAGAAKDLHHAHKISDMLGLKESYVLTREFNDAPGLSRRWNWNKPGHNAGRYFTNAMVRGNNDPPVSAGNHQKSNQASFINSAHSSGRYSCQKLLFSLRISFFRV